MTNQEIADKLQVSGKTVRKSQKTCAYPHHWSELLDKTLPKLKTHVLPSQLQNELPWLSTIL